MKKEYMLISVGGMNGEIWSFEGRYGDLNEVLGLDLLDVNEVRFRNSYDEKDWEGYYGDMNDGLDEWIDRDKESVNRVMLINEGLEMYELNVFEEKKA
jgi:hypothetical protein